jgi:hypothetical protein
MVTAAMAIATWFFIGLASIPNGGARRCADAGVKARLRYRVPGDGGRDPGSVFKILIIL